MNQPRASCDRFPLFQEEPEIWNSLEKPTQQQVLDCLALLLLRHLQQDIGCAAEERSIAKGCST
jgi:hypothetical protein